jgi:hypothetical protein
VVSSVMLHPFSSNCASSRPNASTSSIYRPPFNSIRNYHCGRCSPESRSPKKPAMIAAKISQSESPGRKQQKTANRGHPVESLSS